VGRGFAMLSPLNTLFSQSFADDDRQRVVDALAADGTLADLAKGLGLLTDELESATDFLAVLAAWPAGQTAAVKAALASAVQRQVPVTVAWAPAYDFEVQLWEGGAADPYGLTVLLRSRNPGDLGS
jgi:hypothetical protein